MKIRRTTLLSLGTLNITSAPVARVYTPLPLPRSPSVKVEALEDVVAARAAQVALVLAGVVVRLTLCSGRAGSSTRRWGVFFIYSYSHATYIDHGGVHSAQFSCPQSAR